MGKDPHGGNMSSDDHFTFIGSDGKQVTVFFTIEDVVIMKEGRDTVVLGNLDFLEMLNMFNARQEIIEDIEAI